MSEEKAVSVVMGAVMKAALDKVTPKHPPFLCPQCGEACPFPTQCWESLSVGEDPREKMSTCGCGATHKLTRASGALCEVPEGVAIDKGWRAKLDAKLRAERDAETKDRVEKAEALKAAGKCPHCEGTGAFAKAGG